MVSAYKIQAVPSYTVPSYTLIICVRSIIHIAACEEPALVSDNNPQDHGNVSVLMVSELGYGRPSLEGESARLSCPPELVQVGPNLTTCTGNGRWEPDPMKVACKGIAHFLVTGI